jgi:KUP system potassium uptake protein
MATSSPAPKPADAQATSTEHSTAQTGFLALTVGSIGVVYGDIGTSPLYAFREAVHAATAGGASGAAEILGVLSLILWALILIVTVKYVLILIRADNRGEGGTLALMALAQRALGKPHFAILLLGVIATALFYGDALLTPALSVLSAVEGLEVTAPVLDAYVVPLTVVILLVLFLVQSRGTAKVASFFGPVTIVWFLALAAMGLASIADNPAVLAAFNPLHGIVFLSQHGVVGLLTLGSVFLAVTGAEALYADLGHFGRRPIQFAWLFLVLPALALNYLGQGAAVLAAPEMIENPFFLMYPDWARLPMVLLATAATVIASQAVITGAYSLSRQAVQLGLLPRLEFRHTSETQFGQIFVPRINTLLLVGVLVLVVVFQSSSALASAYGIAVSGTMVVTTTLAFVVVWKFWRWPLWLAVLVLAPFVLIEGIFFFSNLLKVLAGGWVPLLLGAILVVVMLTWRRGSRILLQKTRRSEVPLPSLIDNLESKPPHRIPGTAVFLTGDPKSTPTALLHSLKHYKVLHERNVILNVLTVDSPRTAPDERLELLPLGQTFWRMTVRYGFMETPNIPKAVAMARREGFALDIMSTSFFLSRRTIQPARERAMPLWQDKLFIFLARSAFDASSYFRLPTDRVVEIGTQVVI